MAVWANMLLHVTAAPKGILDLVYPRTCFACGGQTHAAGNYLCWDCLATLPFICDPYCSICGDPFDGAVDHAFVCSWCERHDPAFERARSALRYRGCVPRLLQGFKYQHATYLSADFSLILAGCVRAHLLAGGIDAIAYVPLHPRKARTRSYNQARLLAEHLSRQLQLPIERNALRRIRWTSTQTRLSAEARRQNVDGAFITPIPDWVQGRRWLLVDDVMTTGATVAACAKVLCDAGATRVVVATLARG
ncbi:MAG: ComF family protein [Kiritimatiellia bacterium]